LLKIGETPCAVIAMMCGPCFFGMDEIPFAWTEEMPFYKTSAKYKCSTQRWRIPCSRSLGSQIDQTYICGV
jgi:hypothetical protein